MFYFFGMILLQLRFEGEGQENQAVKRKNELPAQNLTH